MSNNTNTHLKKLNELFSKLQKTGFYPFVIISFLLGFYIILILQFIKVFGSSTYEKLVNIMFIRDREDNTTFSLQNNNPSKEIELDKKDYLTEDDILNSDDGEDTGELSLEEILRSLEEKEEESETSEGENMLYHLKRWSYALISFAIVGYIFTLFGLINRLNSFYFNDSFFFKTLIVIGFIISFMFYRLYFALILGELNRFRFTVSTKLLLENMRRGKSKVNDE